MDPFNYVNLYFPEQVRQKMATRAGTAVSAQRARPKKDFNTIDVTFL
jgi:hypothetical protein